MSVLSPEQVADFESLLKDPLRASKLLEGDSSLLLPPWWSGANETAVPKPLDANIPMWDSSRSPDALLYNVVALL